MARIFRVLVYEGKDEWIKACLDAPDRLVAPDRPFVCWAGKIEELPVPHYLLPDLEQAYFYRKDLSSTLEEVERRKEKLASLSLGERADSPTLPLDKPPSGA